MGGRVLIVDDEPDVATYLATALRANGYTAVVADSAASGLAQLKKAAPDLICLDIMMPEESGISMYSRLRQTDRAERIPVIVISGVVQEGRFDFRSYVPDESVPPPERFMEKPVEVERFLATVGELLASRHRTGDKGCK